MAMTLETSLSAIDRCISALRESRMPEHAAELVEARAAVAACFAAHITQPAQPCPYVVGSDEGTHYCRLNGPPQPAQAVDVGAINGVIVDLEERARSGGIADACDFEGWADRLTAALPTSPTDKDQR